MCLFAWADFIDAQMFSQQIQTVRSRPCFSLWNHSYCFDLQPKPLAHFDVGIQWQHQLGKKREEGGSGVYNPPCCQIQVIHWDLRKNGFQEGWANNRTDREDKDKIEQIILLVFSNFSKDADTEPRIEALRLIKLAEFLSSTKWVVKHCRFDSDVLWRIEGVRVIASSSSTQKQPLYGFR